MRSAGGARLRFETDYFRKSNNDTVSRERRIRSVQLKGFHVLALLLLIIAAALVAKQVAAFFLHWEKLNVRDFQLHQPPAAEVEKIRSILAGCRGNILAIDLQELEDKLQQLPEVKDVAVSRLLPDTVRIDFQLRQPCFCCRLPGCWRILDDSGHTISEQATVADGLIVIQNTAVDDLPRLLPFTEDLRRIERPLAYVAWRLPHGLEIKLRDVPEILYPGESNVAEKIRYYFAVQPRLGIAATAVAYADLRWENRIYLGFNANEEASREK